MKHDSALQVANELVKYLGSTCSRIEIGGSVRRGKPEVKDIEIVAIPDLRPVPPPRLEFGKPIPKKHETMLDAMLWEMKQSGAIFMEKDGPRYKKFILRDAGISVDLFLVLPPAQWGVQMVIRTGPFDFSHWLVTRKSKGGALPNDYIVEDGVVGLRVKNAKNEDSREGEIEMPEEIDFLNFCGVGWIDPGKREARWGKG